MLSVHPSCMYVHPRCPPSCGKVITEFRLTISAALFLVPSNYQCSLFLVPSNFQCSFSLEASLYKSFIFAMRWHNRGPCIRCVLYPCFVHRQCASLDHTHTHTHNQLTSSTDITLQWRHNEPDGVSNHRRLDRLLIIMNWSLFNKDMCSSKKN